VVMVTLAVSLTLRYGGGGATEVQEMLTSRPELRARALG
jgi:hypothetical protein